MKTRKKAKVIGYQKLFTEDGTIVECQVMNIEERDANFHKIWLGHIIQSLDLIGNQKIRLANFILQNLDSDNKLIMTQRKMAEKSNISYFTVAETMKALQEANFLTKINSGAYQVNPDIIFKGGKGNRMNVLLQYNQAKTEAAATKITQDTNVQMSLIDNIQEITATTETVDPRVPNCPRCKKGFLQHKEGKHGPFIGCTEYPNCKYTETINQDATA